MEVTEEDELINLSLSLFLDYGRVTGFPDRAALPCSLFTYIYWSGTGRAPRALAALYDNTIRGTNGCTD